MLDIQERKKKLEFAIRHFAGSVSYTVTGFLDKNKDVLPDGCVQTCRASGLSLVAQWFTDDGGAQTYELRERSLKRCC